MAATTGEHRQWGWWAPRRPSAAPLTLINWPRTFWKLREACLIEPWRSIRDHDAPSLLCATPRHRSLAPRSARREPYCLRLKLLPRWDQGTSRRSLAPCSNRHRATAICAPCWLLLLAMPAAFLFHYSLPAPATSASLLLIAMLDQGAIWNSSSSPWWATRGVDRGNHRDE